MMEKENMEFKLSARRARPLVVPGLVIILFLILLLYLAIFYYAAYKDLMFPYELKYRMEGSFILHGMQALRGQLSYMDPSAGDMTSLLYPPVFELLIAALIYLFGLSFKLGSLISLAACTIISILIYIIVRRHTNNVYVSMGAALSFFALQGITGQILAAPKPDTLGLMFSVGALYFIERYKENRFSIYIGFALLLVSAFTKQDAAIFAAAAAIFLFMEDKKLAIIFTGLFGLASIGLFYVLNQLSSGFFFYYIIKIPAMHDIVLSNLGHLAVFVAAIPVLFAVIVSYSTSAFFFGENRKIATSVWFVALVVSVPFSIQHMVMRGAGRNTIYVMAVLMVIVGAVIIARYWQKIQGSHHLKIMLLLLLIFQMLSFAYNPKIPNSIDLQNGKIIDELIKQTEGEVLIADAPSFLLANGKKVRTFVGSAAIMEKLTGWRPKILLDQIESQHFDLILMFDNYAAPAVYESISRNYVLVGELSASGGQVSVPMYKIYKPRRQLQ